MKPLMTYLIAPAVSLTLWAVIYLVLGAWGTAVMVGLIMGVIFATVTYVTAHKAIVGPRYVDYADHSERVSGTS